MSVSGVQLTTDNRALRVAAASREGGTSSSPITRRSDDSSLAKMWALGSAFHAGRDVLGILGNKIYTLDKAADTFADSRFFKNISTSTHYLDLLGLDRTDLTVGRQDSLVKSYRELLFTREGRKAYADVVRKNFKPELRKNITLKGYFRDVLWKDNLRQIFQPLTGGYLFTTLLRSAAAGLACFEVGSKTLNGYRQAKTEEKDSSLGRVGTWLKTGWTFVGQAAKAVFTWEAATIAFLVTRRLVPVVGLNPIFGLGWGAGIVASGLAGAAAYKLASVVIKDPPKPSKEIEDKNPFRQAGTMQANAAGSPPQDKIAV